MKSPFERLSDWLFSITEPGKILKLQRDKLICLVVELRRNYKSFGILSPGCQFQMNQVIDEIRGELGDSAKRTLSKANLTPLEVFDVVPRSDYEELRASNERLMRLVEKYMIDRDAEGQPKTEEAPEEAPSV